jgi:pimeloyl-ACP methyl ester carboxylesterase
MAVRSHPSVADKHGGVIAASGLRLTEHELEVPLHPNSDESLTIFAREVAEPDGLDKPFLIFLQGGPGFESPRPAGPAHGWMERALQDFRVLLLDQRGTGRSSIAPTDAERWAVLGQSFGGLCVCTYLSTHPEHLSEGLHHGRGPGAG